MNRHRLTVLALATLLAFATGLSGGCASGAAVVVPVDAKVYQDTTEERAAWYAGCEWCRRHPQMFRPSTLPGGSRPGYRPGPSASWLLANGYTHKRQTTAVGPRFVAVAAELCTRQTTPVFSDEWGVTMIDARIQGLTCAGVYWGPQGRYCSASYSEQGCSAAEVERGAP
jgi:hypothetical protein